MLVAALAQQVLVLFLVLRHPSVHLDPPPSCNHSLRAAAEVEGVMSRGNAAVAAMASSQDPGGRAMWAVWRCGWGDGGAGWLAIQQGLV